MCRSGFKEHSVSSPISRLDTRQGPLWAPPQKVTPAWMYKHTQTHTPHLEDGGIGSPYHKESGTLEPRGSLLGGHRYSPWLAYFRISCGS